jgi:hypothetical protein
MIQLAQSVYQINSSAPIPLASVPTIGFPTQGIMIRTANDQFGNPGILLSTGVRCYGNIQVTDTGSQYLVLPTAAQLVTLCNS